MTVLTDAQQQDIKQQRLDGSTIREIAAKTGFAMSTVERYLGIFGLTDVGNFAERARSEEKQRERWRLAMPW